MNKTSILFILILLSICSLSVSYGSEYSYKVHYMNKDVVKISADLNGNGKQEIINIKQVFRDPSASGKVDLYVDVFESSKKVFEYAEQSTMAIYYVMVIKFPGFSDQFNRDIVFLVADVGRGDLNVLCWELRIGEEGVPQNATSRSRYLYFKTGIEIATPYGFLSKDEFISRLESVP